jgi:plasmid stabilization system protein ParE
MPKPRILPRHAVAFLEAYEEKLRQLARFPESGPLIANAPHGYPLRAFLIRKFPYSIIAGSVEGVTTIVAVAHTSREPSYWRGRLK